MRFVTTSSPARPPAVPRQRRVRSTSMAMVAIVAMLTLTSIGCASNTTPSTTTSTPTSAAESSSPANDPAGKEQVCAARDQLETSVTALTSVSLLAEGTSAIQAAVTKVQSDLAAVKKAGKQDYEAEVDAMQSAVDQLQTAAGNLGNGDAAANLQAVGTAIAATGTAADNLFTKLKTACGS